MTTMKDANAIQYKTVLILTKGASQKPDVKRRCEELKYKGNEQIEWVITPPDVPFTIKFKEETGSPFEGKKSTIQIIYPVRPYMIQVKKTDTMLTL